MACCGPQNSENGKRTGSAVGCKWWLRIQRWKVFRLSRGILLGYRHFVLSLFMEEGVKVMYALLAFLPLTSVRMRVGDGIIVWQT